MGRRTAEKAKIICPPPSGVDIIIPRQDFIVMNTSCKFEKSSYIICFVRAVTAKSLYTLSCFLVDTIMRFLSHCRSIIVKKFKEEQICKYINFQGNFLSFCL